MTEPEIKKSLQEIMTEAYNKAIDDAIESVKPFMSGGGIHLLTVHSLCKAIISKLEALKKKP